MTLMGLESAKIRILWGGSREGGNRKIPKTAEDSTGERRGGPRRP